jgi:predicted ribosomally synthesized peptide with SipW-like signal peptide
MNSKRARILLTLGAVLTVASIGIGAVSMAVFTDTESVDATFSSGTIILDAAKIDALTLTTAGPAGHHRVGRRRERRDQ